MKNIIAFFMSILFVGHLSAAVQLLNGAGSTFVYPIFSKWFSEYNKQNPDVRINYQSIGSGAGIKQLISRTVDFGASDTPMTDEELLQAKEKVLHIPTVLGAVVISYNLPGISASLNLDSEVLESIFLGKIKKWNDEKLAKLNPTLKLPDVYITPVYRSDGSGTTAVFTDYLAKVSAEWKKQVGAGKSVKWPTGLGGKGNEGVAGMIKQTPGGIGYIEQTYAMTNKLPVASIKNQSGKFVTPSLESVTAAAEASLKNIPADFRTSITNATGDNSYPIAGMVYVLVYKKPAKQAKEFSEFLKWSLTKGQAYASDLSYAPLPKSLAQKVEKQISTIEL